MTVGPRSTLASVAVQVGDALRRHGVRAVLTGGACACLHSAGHYVSADMDFIVTGHATQPVLDEAMASLGFVRRGDRYTHARTRFYVEFPRGPLAIGADYQIQPVEYRLGGARAFVLSPTDACRDRLAAFYHWNDRQSLAVAIAIAHRNRVNLAAIRRWSVAEGAAGRFTEFAREVTAARSRRRASRS